MAIELIDAKAIYYEIPKTGTTWVRYALTSLGIRWKELEPIAPVCKRHSCPQHYAQRRPEWQVCSVRHPIAWYESYWKYHRSGMKGPLQFSPNLWYPHRSLGEVMPEDFATWMADVHRRQPGFLTRFVESVVGPFGWVACQHVMRQENLASDLACVLRSLGYGDRSEEIAAVGRVNESPGGVVWPDDLRDKVLASETPLIRRFYS